MKDHQPNFDLTNNHWLPAVATDPTNYDLLNEETDSGIGLGNNPHHLRLNTGGAVRNIAQVDNRNMRSETIPQPPESSNELDHERDNPNQTPNFQYVIIDDSILRHVEPCLNKTVINNENTLFDSVPGAKIADLSMNLPEIISHTPDNIIIHIGSNNIKTARYQNQVTRTLWYAVDALKKKLPNSRIIIRDSV